MMYRYFSLVWAPKDLHAQHAATRLVERFNNLLPEYDVAYQDKGMAILHTGETKPRMQAYKLPFNGGIILGKVFNRQDFFVPPRLNEAETMAIIASGGNHLITHYWGRYVAFIKNTKTNSSHVLRDPTGGFPCFFVRYKNIDIYFSDAVDFRNLNILPVSINWSYIAAHIKFNYLMTSKTGLDQVTELLPGQCRSISPDGDKLTFCWDPQKISQADMFDIPTEAATALRKSVLATTEAWASNYNKVIHRLSGGLDSSIVLSSLKQATNRPEITCINYYTPDIEGDERKYARFSARYQNIPLIELKFDEPDISLDKLLKRNKEPQPRNTLFESVSNSTEKKIVKNKNIEACFFGAGGDGIFFQPKTSLCAIDYLKTQGIDIQLLQIIMELARLERKSFWAMLSTVFRNRRHKPEWSPYTDFCEPQTSLFTPGIDDILSMKDLDHPWFSPSEDISLGKLLHIFISTPPANYYHNIPENPSDFLEPVYPLCSQPVIETCLRIPTYILTHGGKDRGLARQAFSELVAPEVIRRETKGGINNHYQRFFLQNIEYIKTMLLEGYLVREKILDQRKLEQALSGNDIYLEANPSQILSFLCTEVWLQQWSKAKLKMVI